MVQDSKKPMLALVTVALKNLFASLSTLNDNCTALRDNTDRIRQADPDHAEPENGFPRKALQVRTLESFVDVVFTTCVVRPSIADLHNHVFYGLSLQTGPLQCGARPLFQINEPLQPAACRKCGLAERGYLG